MSYATPLAERQRLSRRHKERYRDDPQFRLRTINRARVWQGLEPRASTEEIGAAFDRHNRRGDGGRFA
jgi:hypothetical protein